MKRIVTAFLFACSAWAADYTVVRKAALSAASEAVTVQSPVSSSGSVTFLAASVYCSVACEVTMERDGAAATSTSTTPVQLNASPEVTPKARAYYSSNVGSGTTIGSQVIAAGQTVVFDLSRKGLTAGKNFTIRTDSITGNVTIQIQWTEY